MFSCEFCKIIKNAFSTEHHQMTASVGWNITKAKIQHQEVYFLLSIDKLLIASVNLGFGLTHLDGHICIKKLTGKRHIPIKDV